MKELSGRLFTAVALSAVLFIAPSIAAPLPIHTGPTVSTGIVNVESRIERQRGYSRQRRHRSDNFEWRGDSAYYNNHRGYRERRQSYRLHHGWWFPPAAFVAGAILGGGLNNTGYGASHESWCHDRYRSYRSSNNSFQPYGGGSRKSCDSPQG